VGYFFKLQGYYPARAKPGARPEKAPLVIGRVVWAEPAPAETAGASWPWAWVVLGAMVMLVAAWWGLRAMAGRPGARRMIVSTHRPGALSTEEWLDQAAAGVGPRGSGEGDPGQVPGGPDAEGTGNGKGNQEGDGRGLDGAPPSADN